MFYSQGSETHGGFMDADKLSKLSSVDLSADIIAVKLTLDGVFDARIKELLAIKSSIDKSDKIVKTVTDAEKIKKDAVATLADATDAAEAVRVRLENVAQRESEILRNTDMITARSDELTKRESDLQKQLARFRKDADNRDADYATRIAEIDAIHAQLATDRKLLDDQRSAFNEKLQSLRA